MSDFSRIFAESEDQEPEAARMLLRSITVGGAAPTSEVPLRTSVTAVMLDAPVGAEQVVSEFAGWSAPQLRLELMVLGDESGRVPPMVRESIDRVGAGSRVIARPRGNRAVSMLSATEEASGEVLMLLTPGPTSFDLVARALWWMWVEGCDVALVPPSGAESQRVSGTGDAAVQLAEWFGIGGGSASPGPQSLDGRMVLIRRWAARWLFSEIDRAIDPAEEVADRARLLGLGIVQLCDSTVITAATLAEHQHAQGPLGSAG